MDWSSDEKIMITSSLDNKIRIYDTADLILNESLEFSGSGGIIWIAFSNADEFIIASSKNEIVTYNTFTRE